MDKNPFFERSSVYLYSVSDGVGIANKTLILKQYVYNVVPVTESIYLMDGGDKEFGIRTNTPFSIEVKDDPHNIVRLKTTQGAPNTSAEGSRIQFSILDDLSEPTLFQKDVTLTVKSTFGLFPDTDFILKCASGIIQPKSNSYMLKPNGIGILVPVARANDSFIGQQLNATDEFKTGLVWTENSEILGDNASVKTIRSVGTGNTGYILVIPGAKEGNSVVALKSKSGTILWSWHIWVTNYEAKPVGKAKIMDRNLGALSNKVPTDINDIRSAGMYYQWGRKDPMPIIAKLETNSENYRKVYNEKGELITIKNINGSGPTEVGPSGTNFEYSLKYPLTRITNDANSRNADWLIRDSDTKYDMDLWHPTKKTVYDPCPSGWRVPGSREFAAFYRDENWTDHKIGSIVVGRTLVSDQIYFPALGDISNYNKIYLGRINLHGATRVPGWSTVGFINGFTLSNIEYNSYGVATTFAYRFSSEQVRCIKE